MSAIRWLRGTWDELLVHMRGVSALPGANLVVRICRDNSEEAVRIAIRDGLLYSLDSLDDDEDVRMLSTAGHPAGVGYLLGQRTFGDLEGHCCVDGRMLYIATFVGVVRRREWGAAFEAIAGSASELRG